MSRKRGNGEGSITKRKDGRWMARYTRHTAGGRKRKTVYGKTRAEAAAKLAKAVAERDGGVAFDASKITFGEYLNLWLEDSVRDSVKERTLLTYEQTVRKHLRPTLGNVPLKRLTAAHLQSLYRAKLDEGLSAKTVLGIHSVARKALGQALQWDLVARNPAAATKPPRPQSEEVAPLSREEARLLLKTSRAEGDRLEALYVLA